MTAGYPLRMTRDLDTAKDYFHTRYAEVPDARHGLVDSSPAGRRARTGRSWKRSCGAGTAAISVRGS
jgi:hypothetical protein